MPSDAASKRAAAYWHEWDYEADPDMMRAMAEAIDAAVEEEQKALAQEIRDNIFGDQPDLVWAAEMIEARGKGER